MIRRKIPWTSQPQSPVELDPKWAPIITFASLPGLPFRKDLKTKTQPTKIGTVDSSATRVGIASVPADVSSGYRWTGLTPISNTNNGYAYLVVAAPVSRASNGRVLLLGDEAAAAYKQSSLIFNMDKNSTTTAGKVAVVEYNSVALSCADTANTAVDGNWHVWVINRPAGTSSPVIYKDGVNITATSTAGAGIALPAGVYLHVPPTSSAQGYIDPLALSVVFNRPLTASEIAILSASLLAPLQIFTPQTRNIFVSAAGGGDVTLTPSLFTDADTFYAPIVALGSVGLTPSLFTNTNTFYAPVVASSASLIPSLFADSDTFYAATAAPGVVDLAPSLYADADTFYAATVTAGGALFPAVYVDADTFYTAVVAATGALGDIYNAVGYFATGGTVTISLYNPITGTAVSLASNACPEIGTTGVYIWNSTKLSAQPTGYQEYAYKMSNGATFSGGVMIMAITAQDVATAVWAETLDVITAEQTMKVMLATLAGKRAGIGTATERYYDSAGTTAVVTFAPDARGNGIPTVTP